MFLYFFSRKTCATGFMAPSATILHHHGFPRRSGAAPSTVNTGPRAFIFEYGVGHQHVPQAWRPPMGAAQARYGFYCHHNTRYVKINRKIMVASFLPSWLQSAPMARLGALVCAQYRPTSAHIRVCWTRTWVPRMCGGKLIGAVGNDECTIALGDMGQKQRKTLVPLCIRNVQ